MRDDPKTMHGRVMESILHGTFSFERAFSQLAWLAKGDRWKQCGFDNPDDFVKTLGIGKFRMLVAQRKDAARLFVTEIGASRRSAAKALEVDRDTINRDVAGIPPRSRKGRDKSNGDNDAIGGNPATPLTGEGIARLAANKEKRNETLASRKIERTRLVLDAQATGKATVILADPPWQYSNSGLAGSAEDHYATMSTKEICAMPVEKCVTEQAAIFLWATNPLLDDAIIVMKAWGFTYKTNFVWIKHEALYGKLGFYNYGQHELLLVGSRGSFPPEIAELPGSIIEAQKTEHSRKPACVYELIEGMYPTCIPTMKELFCRGEGRRGWMPPFGNEALAA